MRWYKHYTDSSRDEKLTQLSALEGNRGYGLWWRMLEIIADKMESADECQMSHPIDVWARFLWETPDEVRRMFPIISGLDLAEITIDDKSIATIRIPKLAELHDEYTRKRNKVEITPDNVRTDSGVTPDKLPSRLDKNRLDKIKEPLSAKKTADPNIKVLIDYFATKFKEKHEGETYIVMGGKDGSLMKKILQVIKDPEVVKGLIDTYFSMNGKTYAGKNAKSISMFYTCINDVKQHSINNKPFKVDMNWGVFPK